MPYHVSRERFDWLVSEALRKIPKKFRRYLKNVRIVVEDYPSEEEAKLSGARRDRLLGLFSGTSFPVKDGFFDIPSPMPDSIILYQKNIEAASGSAADLVEEIRLTLIHEVGHYFGLSEDDLRQYE